MKPEHDHLSLNILLADDDTDDCFLFDKALSEIPIATKLATVKDGDELMDFLSDDSYRHGWANVLFLDLSMPRKTGFECLHEIRENINLKDMYVIMFSTSYSKDDIYEQGMINMLYKIGAQDYIRKPADFSQFKQIIHEALIRVIEKQQLATVKK